MTMQCQCLLRGGSWRLDLTSMDYTNQYTACVIDAFAKKWKKFATEGMDKLLVISDFDQTLTPYFKPNGSSQRFYCC